MAVLLSGTALAHAITFALSPVLSRLYSPESFGVLGTILAISAPFTVVSSLKYEMALVLEKDDQKAGAIQHLCFSLIILTSMITLFSLWIAPNFFKNWDLPNQVDFYYLWCGLIVFFGGLFAFSSYGLNRERAYGLIANANIVQKAGVAIVQIFFGLTGASAIGLIWGNIAGLLCSIFLMLWFGRKYFSFNSFSLDVIKDVSRKHYRFPLYSAPQNLLNAVSQNIPVYLLGYFFGVAVVGFYWFAMRILLLPSTLIGQSVRQVFYREAASLEDEPSKMLKLYIKTSISLLLLILPPILLIFFWGGEIFATFFGAEWQEAGNYSRWLFLWAGLLVVNPPATSVLTIMGKQKFMLYFDVMLLISRTVALLLGCFYLAPEGAIFTYSVVGVIFNLSIIICAYWFLKKRTIAVKGSACL
ncbi:MAG: oligosaccharide flippase family protein [Desulfuromonadales bacterium]|nr:oligosaccharide flippase family protein [Desulfuromonadales bacterium]